MAASQKAPSAGGTPRPKLRVATVSLAGCFGCHMSLLDLDERLVDLLDLIELDRTPLTDLKTFGHCDLGIVEGGVGNAENVEVLRAMRRHCAQLAAFGACAIDGGVPAMRNNFALADCLSEAFEDGIGLIDPGVPDDPELPLLLRQVRPVHEVVQVDHFLPGCPPSADAIWTFLSALLEGRPVRLPRAQLRYD